MLDEATTRTFASMISVMPQHNPILQMRRQRLRKVSGGKKKKNPGLLILNPTSSLFSPVGLPIPQKRDVVCFVYY